MCILCTPRPTYWSTYRPSVDRYVRRHISQVSIDMSIKMCRSIYRPTYRSSISRYVDWHSTYMLVDMSTESGCPIVGRHVDRQATDIPPIFHCYFRIGDCRHHLTCRLVTSAAQISLIYFPLLRGFFVYNPACLSSVPYHHLVILHRPYPLSCQLYFVYLAVFHLSVLLDNVWICGTWRPNVKPSEIFKVDQKGWNAHNLYTNSLSFWPIYHQQSTDIPPTINGQHIGRVWAAILTEISADSCSICRISLGRYLGWYIGRYVTSRSTYRPTLDQYVGRYISQHSANMSTDTSVECQSICWPRCRPIYRSRGCTKYTWSNIYWIICFVSLPVH